MQATSASLFFDIHVCLFIYDSNTALNDVPAEIVNGKTSGKRCHLQWMKPGAQRREGSGWVSTVSVPASCRSTFEMPCGDR